jgi:AraC family transcriptional regulator, regulatory protein of adaptative response / methylated-DNA-[protein]-cysteine methyltransferase
MSTLPSRTEMEHAYLRSDDSYDGVFFLGVRTTAIFCKPSCQARKPRPENVEFFSTAHDAVFAGFRPCKRCRPLELNGLPPEWIRGLLERIDRNPSDRITDGALRAGGIDPARARRYFQKQYGMTFQAYCRGRRLGKSLEQIRRGGDLDDVALGHGYESHSGFREAFIKAIGKAPGQSRDTDALVVAWIESPVGPLVAAANSHGICLLEFTDRRMLDAQFHALRRHFRCPILPGDNEHLQLLKKELRAYFAGELRDFTVQVVFPGSVFQVKVWNELRKIPYGVTVSYEDIACRIGTPAAVRAVGHANGLNRIAIVIPCHRVVNKNGELGGYGGGLWRKKALLELEQKGVVRSQ